MTLALILGLLVLVARTQLVLSNNLPVLYSLQINLGDQQKHIQVFPGNEPAEVALQYCKDNALDEEQCAPILQHLCAVRFLSCRRMKHEDPLFSLRATWRAQHTQYELRIHFCRSDRDDPDGLIAQHCASHDHLGWEGCPPFIYEQLRSAVKRQHRKWESEFERKRWSPASTHYEKLDVAVDATISDIKRAWRRLSLQYHPDKTRNSNSTEKFLIAQQAYTILTDPSKKQGYDESINVNQSNNGNLGVPSWIYKMFGDNVKVTKDSHGNISIQLG